jgi:hypothetical protein
MEKMITGSHVAPWLHDLTMARERIERAAWIVNGSTQ